MQLTKNAITANVDSERSKVNKKTNNKRVKGWREREKETKVQKSQESRFVFSTAFCTSALIHLYANSCPDQLAQKRTHTQKKNRKRVMRSNRKEEEEEEDVNSHKTRPCQRRMMVMRNRPRSKIKVNNKQKFN